MNHEHNKFNENDFLQMSGGGNFSLAMNPGNQQIQPPRRGVVGTSC